MSRRFLGVDTSNYTTSCALCDERGEVTASLRRLLPVREGAIGLRQNDAVYLHVKQLGELLEELFQDEAAGALEAVGVSAAPLDRDGSFMPCFLTGVMAAQAVSASHGIPLRRFSHQAGHLMAALYGAGKTELAGREFLAFHLSGGTTQCVRARPDAQLGFEVEPVCGTLDLNAGQVVDRVGGMLGLGFPAGPRLEELAERSDQTFRPKPAMKGADCCLSGVENQCAKRLADGEPPEAVARYCLSYLAEALLAMTRAATLLHPGLPLVYAGGVMSNRFLRDRILREFEADFAPPQYSADNAAGIALLAARVS